MKKTILLMAILLITVSCKNNKTSSKHSEKMTKKETTTSTSTSKDWFAHLDEAQYKVLKEKATERPFTGKYNLHFEEGTYACAACGTVLFDSKTKFDGHCGWPSFDEAIAGTVDYIKDSSHGMIRTEIVCHTCGGHLGHIFDDGPTETGKRYCVNSLSLDFTAKKDSIKK